MYVPPFATEADVVCPTFFDLLKLARRLPSILGGMVSLIFREGSLGVTTGSAVEEEEAIGAAGILLLELGLVAV